MVRWVNIAAVTSYLHARVFTPSLLVPHFSIEDIRSIDAGKLREYGFKGAIFDKDDTLTWQYNNAWHGYARDSYEKIADALDGNVLVKSNCAGVWLEDRLDKKARETEENLGVKVVRSFWKKPWGLKQACYELNCNSGEVIIVDDRVSTGILGGNKLGMLTIYVKGFSVNGENRFEKGLRSRERRLVKSLLEKGLQAPIHEKYHQDICLNHYI